MCVHAAQAPSSQHILTHICKHMCEFTEARHRPLSLFYLLPGYESQPASSAGRGGGARESGSATTPSAGLRVFTTAEGLAEFESICYSQL